MIPSGHSLVDALNPAVFSVVLPNPYSFRDILNRLDSARKADDIAEQIRYAKKILELMTSEVIRPFYHPSNQTSTNLKLLHQYCALPSSLLPWLNRLSDYHPEDALQPHRSLTRHDGEITFAILLRWLQWYFCEYPWGLFLDSLFRRNIPLGELSPQDLSRIIKQIELVEGSDQAFLHSLELNNPQSWFLLTPVLPTIAAEALISQGRLEVALQILEIARQHFPQDLRLRQLHALHWSRKGRNDRDVHSLHRAQLELESLQKTTSFRNEETLGILAGTYKALAELEEGKGWIDRAAETYLQGWNESQYENTYLGINAATSSFLVGNTTTAQSIASSIRKTLEGLEIRLAADTREPRRLNYWDKVTLAEACLLMEDFAAAGRHYREAFSQFPDNTADREVSRQQALRILQHMKRLDQRGTVLGDSESP